MSEELSNLVQIIELYGRGMGALGRALRFTAKGAKGGVDFIKVKNMQRRMRLHYASIGRHNTMRLADLEKLTGANYNILNIPLEGKTDVSGNEIEVNKDLIEFYDQLKKLHVSFAELPDLNIGDGYTQIAYNPQDTDKVRFVVEQFQKQHKNMHDEPRNIDLEGYVETAEKIDGKSTGDDILKELAENEYKKQIYREQLERIQGWIQDKNYIPISLNLESLLIKEDDKSYHFKMPKGKTNAAFDHVMVVNKSDCLLLDDGQTVFTAINRNEEIPQFHMYNGVVQEEMPLVLKGDKFCQAFSRVDKEKLDYVKSLKVGKGSEGLFPDFPIGRDEETVAPEMEMITKDLEENEIELDLNKEPSRAKRIMGQVLSLEKLKERQANPEYIPFTFDMAQMVAEDKNHYVANLPEYMDEKTEVVRCMIIPKTETFVEQLASGKQRLLVYLKKTEDSSILEFSGDGKKLRDFHMNNEKLLEGVLKVQGEKGVDDFVKTMEKTAEIGIKR